MTSQDIEKEIRSLHHQTPFLFALDKYLQAREAHLSGEANQTKNAERYLQATKDMVEMLKNPIQWSEHLG